MFEKLARPVSSVRLVNKVQLVRTTAFVSKVQEEGFRLSYGALAIAARILGEDSSSQIVAQRGATLVKSLPEGLHSTVCRRNGGYDKAVLAAFREAPADLMDRPVLAEDVINRAVEAFLASQE